MHDKWKNSDPQCFLILARFLSPCTLKLSPHFLILGPLKVGMAQWWPGRMLFISMARSQDFSISFDLLWFNLICCLPN